MFKIIRKKGLAKGIITVLAISFLIGIFISWGAARTGKTRQSRYIGTIFNKKISQQPFMDSLKASYVLARMQFGENFYKLKDIINLEAQAWDRLIIVTAAQKQRIKISDKELVNYIREFPLFQSKAGFSLEHYNLITQNLGMTTREFEEMMRQQKMIEKLYEKVVQDIGTTDEEVLTEYKNQNETVNLDIISILPADFTDRVTVDIQEAKKYYEANSDDFKIPDKVNVEYIGINYKDEITPEEKIQIKENLNNIYKKLRRTKDIKKTAEENSLDLKETGLFALNEPIAELGWLPGFSTTAFFLATDSISEPIDTPRGCYILKLKESNPAYVPEFEEIKGKATDKLKLEKSREIAKQESIEYQKEIADKLAKNPKLDLEKIAEQLKLKYTNKEDFKRNSYLPGLGISKDVENFAFDLTKNSVSDVIEMPSGFYILRRVEFNGIDQEKFEEEKESLTEKFLQQKKDSVFSEYVDRELKPQTSLFVDFQQDKNLPY